MELQGKIINVLDAREGVSSSGTPWKVQPYVLETQEQYPKKVCFEVFGEDRIAKNTCMFDDMVKISFEIESREFNGRWFTSIRAWKVDVLETQPADEPAQEPAQEQQPAADYVEAEDDAQVPF